MFALIITLGINIVFFQYFMPPLLLIAGILIILLFFRALHYYTFHWQYLPDNLFYKKIFRYSFLFRLLFVGYMYLLAQYLTGSVFKVPDAWTYHGVGADLVGHIFSGNFTAILEHKMAARSDWGYTFYTGLLYTIFGTNTLPVRLLNCLWGSLSVVFLARMAHILYGQRHARLTGIIAMLMPPLLFFGGIQIKETLMIWIVITVFYLAVLIVNRKKIHPVYIAIMVLLAFSLYFFRTFLAVLVMLSVGVYFSLNMLKNRKNKFFIGFYLILFLSGAFMLTDEFHFREAVVSTYESSGSIGERFLSSKTSMVGNLSYSQALVTPLIAGGSFFTPFPSFLYTEKRQKAVLAHFQNEVIRNLLYYFAVLGIVIAFRKKFRKSALFLSFTIGYIIVLAVAQNAFIDRFHLPAVPFIIIFMAVGFLESKPVWLKRWNTYLIIIFMVEVAWNLFKLQIRGLI